jgi:hypothetical protein
MCDTRQLHIGTQQVAQTSVKHFYVPQTLLAWCNAVLILDITVTNSLNGCSTCRSLYGTYSNNQTALLLRTVGEGECFSEWRGLLLLHGTYFVSAWMIRREGGMMPVVIRHSYANPNAYTHSNNHTSRLANRTHNLYPSAHSCGCDITVTPFTHTLSRIRGWFGGTGICQ